VDQVAGLPWTEWPKSVEYANACYGPRFGPLIVEEVRKISQIDGHLALLVKLTEPFTYEGKEIAYFVIAPRYTGDTVETIQNGECTVGVWRVLPDKVGDIASGLSQENAEYWSIGTTKFIEG
jgi:hypothetical protein